MVFVQINRCIFQLKLNTGEVFKDLFQLPANIGFRFVLHRKHIKNMSTPKKSAQNKSIAVFSANENVNHSNMQ